MIYTAIVDLSPTNRKIIGDYDTMEKAVRARAYYTNKRYDKGNYMYTPGKTEAMDNLKQYRLDH